MRTRTMTKVDRCCPHEVNEKLAERIIHLLALYFISCLEKEKVLQKIYIKIEFV
jgi:hypothetical protein